MSRFLLLATVVAIACPRAAGADPVDEGAYVERALVADPRPRAADVDVDAAAAEELAAGVRDNPSAAADREQVFGDGGEAEHVLALDLPLDLSGRRGHRVAAAKARTAAARALRGATDVEVALDARAAYREAAYLRARAALLGDGRGDLARAVEIVRARVAAGDSAAYEVERVELELLEYDDELAEAELERDAAERALGARLGLGPIETTGEVALPAAPPALDSLASTIAARPEVVALDHLDEAADAEAAAAARAWFPAIVLTGGAKSLGGDDAVRWGYVVGVGVELPLFDRGRAERARARVSRRRVEVARAGLVERTATRIAAAREHLTRRRALAEQSAAARAERVDTLIGAAEAAYREGGALADLLDAYRVRRRAQLRALELRHDAAVAEVELWRAVGSLR